LVENKLPKNLPCNGLEKNGLTVFNYVKSFKNKKARKTGLSILLVCD
jgi:hypothetical protein